MSGRSFRMSAMSESVRGLSRRTVTLESGETDSNRPRSLAPSQSAARHDRRKRGLPSESRRPRISSKGVTMLRLMARTSSSPSIKSVLSAPFGMALRLEGQEVAGCNQVGFLPKYLVLGLKRSRLACPRIAEQYIGRCIPERFERPGFLLPMLILISLLKPQCRYAGTIMLHASSNQ